MATAEEKFEEQWAGLTDQARYEALDVEKAREVINEFFSTHADEITDILYDCESGSVEFNGLDRQMTSEFETFIKHRDWSDITNDDLAQPYDDDDDEEIEADESESEED